MGARVTIVAVILALESVRVLVLRAAVYAVAVVVDESGRLLGAVSVPAAPPADPDRAPTCVDVPR